MFGREVKKLKNHVIVCGCGRHGSRACQELRRNNTPYVIIEKDPKQLELPEDEKSPAINGDATLDDTLSMAAIKNARALITTLPHDADNVYITLTAKELNPGLMVISRATDHNSEKKLYRAGADRVVLPDILGALHMVNLITRPYVVEFLEILNGVGNSELRLEEFEYSQLKNKYKDKTLKELDIRKNTGATVVGVKDSEQGFLFGPKHDTQIGQEDVLILLGSEDSLRLFKDYLN
jgi:voltage-gated potassium channel